MEKTVKQPEPKRPNFMDSARTVLVITALVVVVIVAGMVFGW